MSAVAYGVCVGDWDRFRANVLPHTGDRPVVAISGQTSIASAYNAILDAVSEMSLDLLVLQHDDLEITDLDGEAKLLAAQSADNVGVVGVAGGTYCGDIAWWAHEPVGHQQTDAMAIDFGTRSGHVDLLEGSLLAIPGRLVDKIRFDERYPGFHGYDADISRAIQQHLGRDIVVVDVDTHHHNPTGFKSAESHRDWLEADRLFREKWGLP